jgi:sulfatase modifying factor 1
MNLEELLAGLAAHPHEGERWLILADWLEDHGDPRAGLARLRWQYHYEPTHADFEPRRQRLCDLWAAHVVSPVPTLTNALAMTFALIPPGSFWMGSLEGEEERDADETRHRVTLTDPYFLATHPVTVADFTRFTEATAYQTEPERGQGAEGFVNGSWRLDPTITWRNPGFAPKQRPRYPVVCVTWNDAVAFVAWLNQTHPLPGLRYTLPTEAQWEFACRAGTETTFFWGDGEGRLRDFAWYRDNSRVRTHSVASKLPNPWGLYHMIGLAWEWCTDWYGPLSATDALNPTGADEGEQRVLRGGSWHTLPRYCRSADRSYDHPDDADSHTGFRLAITLPRGNHP